MQFQRITAHIMGRVRVNSVWPEICDGARVFVKTRRLGGSLIIWLGNSFLCFADSGIHMFVRTQAWVAWELHCDRLLYPDRPEMKVKAGKTLVMQEVCGISLRELIRSNKLNSNACEAAAREIYRAHQLHCSIYNGGWSHGDLHLDNILYDDARNRAILIDFDTRHLPELNETLRHADDLKTVLLEMISTPATEWQEGAFSFLEAYPNGETLRELSLQLDIPQGISRIFWYTRTANCPLRTIEPRLQRLREIIHQVATTTRIIPQLITDNPPRLESQY